VIDHRKKPHEESPHRTINIPELATRQCLLSAIRYYPALRKKLFRTAQHLESIALISDKKAADKCLSLYWKDERRSLVIHWHDKLRSVSGSDLLFNELLGCLRNVYSNMRVKADLTTGWSSGPFDVVRQYSPGRR